MKAADVSERKLTDLVSACNDGTCERLETHLGTHPREPHRALWLDLSTSLGAPPKVVLAKLRKMVRRGVVSGCACGCRGDFAVREQA